MIDHWVGRVLDVFDRLSPWDPTALFLCTDHGHCLGEKDLFGKPGVPVYEPLGHIPLLVAWPGVAPDVVDALTTSVDVFATLCDLFGASVPQRTHGRSLAPLIRGEATAVRDWLLCGVWGRQVHWIDGRLKYARGPRGANEPLSMWSNRWSTMPVRSLPNLGLPLPDERAFLDRMPGSRVPVLRQPFREGDRLPFWALGTSSGSELYDLHEDPSELRDLAGTPLEREAADGLRVALQELGAPEDQFERLGLA
jgi:arylsulfatase A-like enzyme